MSECQYPCPFPPDYPVGFVFVVVAIGAIAFGLWQKSLLASVWMGITLLFVAGVAVSLDGVRYALLYLEAQR